MNKKALLALAIFTIVVVSVFVYGNIILKQVPQYPFSQTQSSPNPTLTPTSTPSPPPATTPTNNVTVSGLIISHGLTIPPTEVPVHKHRNP